jgi:arylsulfatase
VLEFEWKYDGPGLGKNGTGALKVDDQVLNSRPMPRSLGIVLPWYETFAVGFDTGTPVDDKDYRVPFQFTGKLNKLTVKLGPEGLAPADNETLSKASRSKQ